MEKALFDLNEKLKYPSDIQNKIDSILERLRNENEKQNERESYIFSEEMENVKKIQSNLLKIKNKQEDLKSLKNLIFQILKSNEFAFNQFKSISEIAQAHQNFIKTKEFYNFLKEENSQVNVNDDEENSLLDNYWLVFKYEEMAGEIEKYQSDLSPEESKIVNLKLNFVKKLSLKFITGIFNILENFTKNTNEFGNIEKIFENEEQRDLKIEKVQLGNNNRDESTNIKNNIVSVDSYDGSKNTESLDF